MHSNPLIALFVPTLHGGGTQRVMVTLANGFAARGHRVDLVVATAQGPYLSEVADAVRLVDLRSSRMLRCLPLLVRYLRRERPMAMLSSLSHANVVALLARRLARVQTRIVISERNSLTARAENGRDIRERVVWLLMRILYADADAITVVSSAMCSELLERLRLDGAIVETVYNPIVSPSLKEEMNEPLNHSWFGDPDTPIILGVGRLSRQKDFSTLIRAFAALQERRPARLMILGEGEDRKVLEGLAHDLGIERHVALPGFVKNPFPYMRRASLFVLSSRWEGLPGVLIQAMACGTPVVSTNCPTGPVEILEEGQWGRLVPVGDVGALAEAMRETLDQKDCPNVISRACDFDEEFAISRYLEIIGANQYTKKHVPLR